MAILDDGLRLYRWHFAHFALLATLGVIPIAIITGLVGIAVSWAENTPTALLRLAGGAALLVPMSMYLIGGLSRTAIAAAEGRPVALREALLYREESAAHDGADLAARIAEWQQLRMAPDLHANDIPSTMPPVE